MNNYMFRERVTTVFGRGGILTIIGGIWLMLSTPAWAAPWQVLRGRCRRR